MPNSTNWTNGKINSTGYTDGDINSTAYTNGTTVSTNYTKDTVKSTGYKGVWTYILAGSIVVLAGSTAYDARGLLVGTNTTYSTNWTQT